MSQLNTAENALADKALENAFPELASTPAPAEKLPKYSLSLYGPGLHISLDLREQNDFLIIQALLDKVRRAVLPELTGITYAMNSTDEPHLDEPAV